MEKEVGDTSRLKVKQRIGLTGSVAFIVGSMIGSGIFISPKGALKYSGSIGLSLVIWTGCGVLATLMALVYAELGVLMPRSGGDYTYIRLVIGDLPGFLVTWLQTTVLQPGARTVLALVFADYLCAPLFDDCGPPVVLTKTIAAVELLSLAITNVISVRFATASQTFFTCVKFLALLVISSGGAIYLIQGKTDNFVNAFDGSTTDVTLISLAIYQCMWAYGGYNNLNEIAEEIIQPEKNIPRAIGISLTLVTFVYITTNVSYFAVLTKSEFLSVPAVAFAWGDRVLGVAAIIIPLSVMCSVHGASNGGVFTDGRIRFAGARAGHLPELLSFLHHRTRIPTVSLIFNTVCSLIMLVPGNIGDLINLVSFVATFISSLTVISLLKLKYRIAKENQNHVKFNVPLFVPILALVVNMFMIIAPFISNPRIEFLYGIAYVASGLIFYVPFVRLSWKLPGFDGVTTFFQLLLDVCPTVLEDKEITIN